MKGVYKRGGIMKSTPNISGTGNKSTQVDTTPHEKDPVSTFSLLVIGASFFVLVALTIELYGAYGRLAYLLGMLALAVFVWLSALFALRIRTNRTKKARPARDKVLDALISTLQTSPDPDARLAAVKGLAELDLEESSEHMQHADIDAILISALQTDPDSRVRSAAAEGLSVLELENHSYYHTHDRLYDTLLKHGIED